MKQKGRQRTSWKQIRRTTLAVVWVSGLVLSLLLLGRELVTSSRFAIADVRVVGAERATIEELRAMSGISVGANIFRLDLTDVKARVQSHPWVQRADVQRDLPRVVVIRVREHQPQVLASLGELYLANADGEIIKSYEPGDPWSFPVVTGLEREVVEREPGRLSPAIGLLGAWRNRELPEPSEIRMQGPSGWAVRTVDGRFVSLGRAPFGPKLMRLEEILASAPTRQAVSIRLDGERRNDRATIVMRPASEGGR